jgi:hypothetical protein
MGMGGRKIKRKTKEALFGEEVGFGDGVGLDGVENGVDGGVVGDAVKVARRVVDHDGALDAEVHATGDGDLDTFEVAVLDLALKVGEKTHGVFFVADALAFAVGAEASANEEVMGWLGHGGWSRKEKDEE